MNIPGPYELILIMFTNYKIGIPIILCVFILSGLIPLLIPSFLFTDYRMLTAKQKETSNLLKKYREYFNRANEAINELEAMVNSITKTDPIMGNSHFLSSISLLRINLRIALFGKYFFFNNHHLKTKYSSEYLDLFGNLLSELSDIKYKTSSGHQKEAHKKLETINSKFDSLD